MGRRQMQPGVDLGKHIEDKEILDRNDRRAGKVDDLLLELPELQDSDDADDSLARPEVVAIITGPLALARNLPAPLFALAKAVHRLFGIHNPEPVEIPWDRVSAIDVVVHVDVDREKLGLTELAEAVDRRIIGRIPGAGENPWME